MKNRHVGYLIVGISALIGFIIITFNRALTDIVNSACSHGSSCPMWGTINTQTSISMGVMVFVAIIGAYLIFSSKDEPETKTIKKNFNAEKKELTGDEKLIFEKIIDSEGTIFQSDLVEQTEFTKVKVTRLLDKLEGRGLIERKRRGMTNIVILKR